jgi:hypothetical protein
LYRMTNAARANDVKKTSAASARRKATVTAW